tara:strand:+ start:539 stop:712 length:174 start_codon:yes stop_codon:yes gene_type:complete
MLLQMLVLVLVLKKRTYKAVEEDGVESERGRGSGAMRTFDDTSVSSSSRRRSQQLRL